MTLGLGVDPRLTVRPSATSDKRLASVVGAAFSAAWTSFRAVLRVRTFQVLVLQVTVLADPAQSWPAMQDSNLGMPWKGIKSHHQQLIGQPTAACAPF